MSPLSIVSRNDSPGPWRGPFDGSDWLADPVGTSRRTVTVHREERTTGRRREEIKGGPLRIAPIQSRIEEENARKSRNRAGGPPASSSPACYKYSPSFSKSFAKFSTHLRIVHFLSLRRFSAFIREKNGSEVALRNFNRIVPPSSPVRDFNERCLVSGSSAVS